MGTFDYAQFDELNGKTIAVGVACASYNNKIVMDTFAAFKQELTKIYTAEQVQFVCVGGEEFVRVPGSLELPYAMQKFADNAQRLDVLVALGCVIRGGTSHYDIVCEVSAHALARVSEQTKVPIINGILTCENEAQAIERATEKGVNFAQAAAMMHLLNINFWEKDITGNE